MVPYLSLKMQPTVCGHHSMATRHWGKMADLPGISTDTSLALNFGEDTL